MYIATISHLPRGVTTLEPSNPVFLIHVGQSPFHPPFPLFLFLMNMTYTTNACALLV